MTSYRSLPIAVPITLSRSAGNYLIILNYQACNNLLTLNKNFVEKITNCIFSYIEQSIAVSLSAF